MNKPDPKTDIQPAGNNWVELAAEIGKQFAENAAIHDQDNLFVAENYKILKENRFFSMCIPSKLGGGGASYAETCGVIREFAKNCGSTALAYSMHTHPVAANIFKHHKGDEKATATLKKLAANELIIAGTGANDWLASSGKTTKVDGGYNVNARKHFVSGGPGAQVFVTSAPYEGENGTEVLHFGIPFSTEGVTIHDNWNTLGMRATGSNDVTMENVFVPEESIIVRRPAGEWHPMWNVVLPNALTLIMSAYTGLADAAVAMATESARKRPAELAGALGELLNTHTTATLALDDMINRHQNFGFTPSNENTNDILTRKTLVSQAAMKVVDLAAEMVGGASFFKGHPMERIVRDIRASHFHPLPYRRQHTFSGRIALGLDPVNG